jgi:hypothetical protein
VVILPPVLVAGLAQSSGEQPFGHEGKIERTRKVSADNIINNIHFFFICVSLMMISCHQIANPGVVEHI